MTPENSMPSLTRTIVTPAIVLSVHDGDTATLAVTGVPAMVFAVRLKGVRAMELGTAGGIGARSNLLHLAGLGTSVRVRFTLTKEGHMVQSLGRPVAEIWTEATGQSVNERQIDYLKENNWWGGKEAPLDTDP